MCDRASPRCSTAWTAASPGMLQRARAGSAPSSIRCRTWSPSGSRRRSSLSLDAAGSGRRFGWMFALAYAVCWRCASPASTRSIDVEEQPHKSAGFLTGVPAPAGAGLLLLPILLWLASDRHWIWLQRLSAGRALGGLLGLLMISSVATFSLGSLRLRRHVRLEALVLIAILGGGAGHRALGDAEPDRDRLSAADPVQHVRYARIRRQRAAGDVVIAGRAFPSPDRRSRRPRRTRYSPFKAASDLGPMRLQSEFQDRDRARRAGRGKKTIESQMSHSFSPELSTAQSPRSRFRSLDVSLMFPFCSSSDEA